MSWQLIMRLAGPAMAEDVLVGRATILIASPHRITAYHIDQDLNYLLQIAGDKSFSVFDQIRPRAHHRRRVGALF